MKPGDIVIFTNRPNELGIITLINEYTFEYKCFIDNLYSECGRYHPFIIILPKSEQLRKLINLCYPGCGYSYVY